MKKINRLAKRFQKRFKKDRAAPSTADISHTRASENAEPQEPLPVDQSLPTDRLHSAEQSQPEGQTQPTGQSQTTDPSQPAENSQPVNQSSQSADQQQPEDQSVPAVQSHQAEGVQELNLVTSPSGKTRWANLTIFAQLCENK